VTSLKHDAALVVTVGCDDSTAAHRHSDTEAVTERHQQLADVAEHDDATVAGVSDDELVEGRGRYALGTVKCAGTYVADELGVDAEHAHAVVALVSNSDVTVARREAESVRGVELTVVTTSGTSDAMTEVAVAPAEHTDAVGTIL
jgi:hypothetical protein